MLDLGLQASCTALLCVFWHACRISGDKFDSEATLVVGIHACRLAAKPVT